MGTMACSRTSLGVLIAALLCLHSFVTARADGESGGCQASSLAGFKQSFDLTGMGFVLHWNLQPLTIDYAIEAKPGSGAEQGWVSIGWSVEGKMKNADAVFGNLEGGEVKPSLLLWESLNLTRAMIPFDMGNLTLVGNPSTVSTAENGTIVRFSRRFGMADGGRVPVNATGINHIIWAYSPDGTKSLAHHVANRGSWAIDFTCATAPVRESYVNTVPEGSKCTPSTLANYTCMLEVKPNLFTVHWKPGTNYVSLAAEVASTGWLALGWSPDGRMLDSDAVLFNTLPAAYPFASDGVARVVMLGNTSILPVADTDGYSFVIRNAKVLVNGGRTLAEFERVEGGGTVPFSVSSNTNLLWAFSPDNSKNFSYHQFNRGYASINFVSGDSAIGSSGVNYTAILWHAILLAIGFGLFMPSGILVSRLFLAESPYKSDPSSAPLKGENGTVANHDEEENPTRALAFNAHIGLQVAGLVFILAGCICSFAALGDAGLKWTHGQFGLALFILAFLQPVLGLVRPKKGDSKRGVWHAAHWFVGVSLVVMAWVNVYLGADLFNYIFGANVQWFIILFSIIIGLFSLAYIAVAARDFALPLLGKSPAPSLQNGGGTAV